MSDLSDLYQEVIFDHHKSPRNFRKLDPADRQAEGHNPLCGDEIRLYLNLDGDRVKEIGFQGKGCAISRASASLMTTCVKGMTRQEAAGLFQKFLEMVTSDPARPVDSGELGKLAVFAGVRQFPVRVKCATLAWHTLHSALENKDRHVTTE